LSNLYEVFDDTEQRNTETIAALDIGSNSFHLVVARVVADSVQVLTRVKHKVRLADGLNEQSILSDEAMQRGLDTLESMVESLKGVARQSLLLVKIRPHSYVKACAWAVSVTKNVFLQTAL